MTLRKAFVSLCGINFFIYGLNAIYNCFIPLYLGRHFDEIAVGTLLSIGPIVMLVSPMFWGIITDRAKTKNSVLGVIVIFAALSFFLIVFNQSFVYTALMLAVFMFFCSPYGSLMDTIVLEASQEAGIKYGPIRLMGTVGYGIIAVVASLLPSENELLLFAMYVLTALIGLSFLMATPKIEGHARDKKHVSIAPLLRDKNLTLILIVNVMVMFAFSYYGNFMPSYMTGTLGLPTYIWGINVFVTLAVEFPFFIWFDKIFSRVRLRTLLIITVAVSAARYFLLGSVTHPAAILAVGALTGAWITIATYCGTYYIRSTVPDEIIASGQSYLYTINYGLPKIFAGVLGGIMTRCLGVPVSYYICGAGCLLCLIAAFMFPKEYKKRDDIAA